MTKALVLGAHISSASGSESEKSKVTLTPAAEHFDSLVNGQLKKLVSEFGPSKKGKAKTFYGLHADYPVVSVVGIGSQSAGYSESEDIDEKREQIRSSMAIGAKSVRDESGVDEIHFDSCLDGEAAAEGSHLALWHFDELKSEKYKKKVVKVGLYEAGSADARSSFERGALLAKAQNNCRRLADMPSNLMTPTIFAETVQELFKPFPNVKVVVHDKKWAEEKKMGAFLGVSQGSAEPLRFVEVHYNNKPNTKPVVLVGKGICFDSGGISLKPAAKMGDMRFDMAGAANVVSTILALASLKSEVNVISLTPLCENMPSGTSYKPGDVVFAMNGKSIQVDNTDAEGRLVLADALCYAHEFDPQAILDVATLTGAMIVSLGSAATGVFTPSTAMFEDLRRAGVHTGDRVWRLPLFSHYKNHVTDSALADVLNIGKVAGQAGSCTAAAFLSEFVKCPNWIHLDIAGVFGAGDDFPYYGKGMTGRPVRTLTYYLENFFRK